MHPTSPTSTLARALTLAAIFFVPAPAHSQGIHSVEEFEGLWTMQQWQRYPFEGCNNIDNSGRVAIGRTRYNEDINELEFLDEGPFDISFYESGCTLGDSITSGRHMAVAAQCAAEGYDYEGFVVIEQIDAHTIRLRTPMSDHTTVLASCQAVSAPMENKTSAKLPYGSRAGMEVTVLGAWALDTEVARIYVEHTLADSRAFCTQYVGTSEPKCLEEAMERASSYRPSVGANCTTGEFDTVLGSQYRFIGPNTGREMLPDYIIVPQEGFEPLDGSSASGYGVAINTFTQLCPTRASSDTISP